MTKFIRAVPREINSLARAKLSFSAVYSFASIRVHSRLDLFFYEFC